MNVRSRTGTAAALPGAAALRLSLLPTPASADYTTPPWRPLAAVGSDTTQYVMNGLGEVVQDAACDRTIGSWDAVPVVLAPGALAGGDR